MTCHHKPLENHHAHTIIQELLVEGTAASTKAYCKHTVQPLWGNQLTCDAYYVIVHPLKAVAPCNSFTVYPTLINSMPDTFSLYPQNVQEQI